MTKLMAFDLDGTILFNRAVEPANEQAIARWQAEGNPGRSRARVEYFCYAAGVEPAAIRFDYHVLYTGAVITDRQYRVIYRQPLPVSVVQACYEHFSTVDGVALFATTLDNDYSLCDRVGSSTNILPEFTPLPADDLQNHEYVGVPLWIPDAQAARRRTPGSWSVLVIRWIAIRTGFPGYCAARLHERHRSAASGGVPAVGASG